MALSKDKLGFDVTSANTIAASDSVGAYLRSADGTLFTHTTVGADQALDVNLVQSVSLTVTASDLDIRDLTHVSDSVKVGDGTDFLAINADGSLNITDNGGSLTVDASNLDIRDLTHVSDSVKIGDGTDFLAIAADGSIAVTQGTSPWVVGDGGGSLTVDAVNLDIRDLAAAQDSVSSWTKDGSGNSISSTSNALHVYVSNAAEIEVDMTHNSAVLQQEVTVGTSAVALPTSALSSREKIIVQNLGNRNIYLGAATVTASGATGGLRCAPGGSFELPLGAGVALYAIADAAGQAVRVFEAA